MEKRHYERVLEDMHSIDPETSPPSKDRRWIKWVVGLFIVSILVLWYIPSYAVPVDTNPEKVGKLDLEIDDIPPRLDRIEDVRALEVTQTVRNAALKIVSEACPGSDVCYAKALFNYVRDNIMYVSDPAREYIQSPEETLLGAGDCEDQAILLYLLMESIGIESRLVIVPGHAYLQIYLPEARYTYRGRDGWVNLDPTCSSCDFGETSPFNDEIVRYV